MRPAHSPAALAGASCGGNPVSPWGGKAQVRGRRCTASISPWAQGTSTQPQSWAQVGSGRAKHLQHCMGTEQERNKLLQNYYPMTILTLCHQFPGAQLPAAPQGPWCSQQLPLPGPLQWYRGSVGRDAGHTRNGDTVGTGQDGHRGAMEAGLACVTQHACPGMPAALRIPVPSPRAAHTLPTQGQDSGHWRGPTPQLERAMQPRDQCSHPTCLHG